MARMPTLNPIYRLFSFTLALGAATPLLAQAEPQVRETLEFSATLSYGHEGKTWRVGSVQGVLQTGSDPRLVLEEGTQVPLQSAKVSHQQAGLDQLDFKFSIGVDSVRLLLERANSGYCFLFFCSGEETQVYISNLIRELSGMVVVKPLPLHSIIPSVDRVSFTEVELSGSSQYRYKYYKSKRASRSVKYRDDRTELDLYFTTEAGTKHMQVLKPESITKTPEEFLKLSFDFEDVPEQVVE